MGFKYLKKPKIPTRYYYTGDVAAAKRLKGVGVEQLTELRRDMEFGKHEGQTGEDSVKRGNGTIIKSNMNYGISTVHIHVPKPVSEIGVQEYRCFCAPCIADAIVTAIKNYNGEIICEGDEEPEDPPCVGDYGETTMWGDQTYPQFMGGSRYYYDVDICSSVENSEDEHELAASLENYPVQSAGWEKYYVGHLLYVMFLPGEPVDPEETKGCLYDLLFMQPPLPQIRDIILIQRGAII